MFKRYEKNLEFFNESQLKLLHEKSITVLGTGSVGSLLISTLVRLGIEKITTIDNSVIKEEDLATNIFANCNTVSATKSAVVKDNIKLANSRCKINSITMGLTNDYLIKLLKRTDLVVNTIADLKLKKLVFATTKKMSLPLIDLYLSATDSKILISSEPLKYQHQINLLNLQFLNSFLSKKIINYLLGKEDLKSYSLDNSTYQIKLIERQI